jgi:parvulin-like peptidyl-prolyl isomerase
MEKPIRSMDMKESKLILKTEKNCSSEAEKPQKFKPSSIRFLQKPKYMNKNIFTAILVFTTFLSYSQSENQVKRILKSVTAFNQVDSLKTAHPSWRIFSEILSDIDTTKYPAIKNPVLGEIRQMTLDRLGAKNFLFKIVETDIDQMCRAQYIYLDGEKYNLAQQDSMAQLIAYKHNTGTDFLDLHAEFNMDGSTPDIGWFNKFMVHDAFFDAVFNQYKGNVFSVRVPDVNGIFIIHKTHENIVRNLYKTIWIGYEE